MLKALISPFMLVIAGILVYANSLSNPFIYDDQVAIVDNVDIRQLWPPSWVSPTTLEHAPTNSRPVVSFTLALNYAFGTLDVRGFRAFNIAVHILCSFAIYLVLNQTFSNAEGRALTVALLLLVHPLNSQCIQYVIQRSESLMALCYLLTLYYSARYMQTGNARLSLAAVSYCALGMASKEVMVTEPN